MSQDAIVVLKADHKEIRALFGEFQKSSPTPTRKKLVEQMIELLTVQRERVLRGGTRSGVA